MGGSCSKPKNPQGNDPWEEESPGCPCDHSKKKK
ncbi:hypothetical protein EFREU_v1c04340 [Entomoplasma freundtii]|uniref:Uncharacterized protein n=1 Tax=Entomoplasma freundtii TaxID=74700 RepID=A0A2K8NRK0_9MOLU|nr:hypothetical protein EFREU_v1c04340 [Entomoplasma freundtii]